MNLNAFSAYFVISYRSLVVLSCDLLIICVSLLLLVERLQEGLIILQPALAVNDCADKAKQNSNSSNNDPNKETVVHFFLKVIPSIFLIDIGVSIIWCIEDVGVSGVKTSCCSLNQFVYKFILKSGICIENIIRPCWLSVAHLSNACIKTLISLWEYHDHAIFLSIWYEIICHDFSLLIAAVKYNLKRALF